MHSKIFSSMTDLPVPKNISWWWLGGSLLGLTLVIQMASGYVISCFYTNEVSFAFLSVDAINRDMKLGSMVRHMHIFGASVFFFFIYLHMGRAVYYLSFIKKFLVWTSGVIIYLLLMLTSFVGYVLPWAQMSFWAATVITNFMTVVPFFGGEMVNWVWGSFSVDYTTLMRFYTLHFILPSVLAILSIFHIMVLHSSGSSSPLGMLNKYQRFSSFSTMKDGLGVFSLFLSLFILYLAKFMFVSDPEQYLEANPFVTPVHMVPEWYFLPAYAMLRSVPNKLGGVVLLLSYMIMLLIYPFLYSSKIQLKKMSTLSKILFWIWIMNFFLLVFLGGSLAEQPYIFFSQVCTLVYFLYFFMKSLISKLNQYLW